MRRTSIGLILAIGLALVRTEASQGPNDFKKQLEELSRAESKWLASKTDTYEFRFDYACNGLIPPAPSTVQSWVFRVKRSESILAGDVTDVVRSRLEQFETVEKQFEFIRTALKSRPDRLNVAYDQDRGYPTRVCVDPSPVTDDEYGFVVTDWRILDAKQAPDEQASN